MSSMRHKLGAVFNRHPDLLLELQRKTPDEDIILRGISNGSDLNIVDGDGNNLLMLCAKLGLARAVTVLLDNSCIGVLEGQKVLWAAIRGGDHQVIERVLVEPAVSSCINTADSKGVMPLIGYLHHGHAGHYQVVSLVAAGADVNYQDSYGQSPLLIAASMRRMDIAGTLIENGANINIQNQYGETPLMRVARERYDAEFFLIKGADPYIKDNKGRLPIDEASDEEAFIDSERNYFEPSCSGCITDVFKPYMTRTEPKAPQAPKKQVFVI